MRRRAVVVEDEPMVAALTASALEAVSCVESIATGILPPTLGYETPDPDCALDLVVGAARTAKVDVVLNNALAFGGYDAVLLLAREGVKVNKTAQDGFTALMVASQNGHV